MVHKADKAEIASIENIHYIAGYVDTNYGHKLWTHIRTVKQSLRLRQTRRKDRDIK